MIPSLEVFHLDVVRACRRRLIESNRFSLLFKFNGLLYRFMQSFLVRSLGALPDVRSVYLSHGATVGEAFPGLSDFDLVVVYDPKAADFSSRLRPKWQGLKKFLPARDIVPMSATDFAAWQSCGGGESLFNLREWRCLYGEDLRTGISASQNQLSFDTARNSLGYYWQLLLTAVKESSYQPYLAVFERRQLYKFFAYSVLPLYDGYEQGKLYERLGRWSRNFNDAAGEKLLYWREKRFFEGSLSRDKFTIAAQAILRINAALKNLSIASAPRYSVDQNTPPERLSTNYADVAEHLKPFVNHLVELGEHLIKAIRVSGNGSPRGWRLFVIVKDGLVASQLAELFRLILITFRMHDDPWFNEHFSTSVPIIYTEHMFDIHMKLWPEDAVYINNFPSTLYGPSYLQHTEFSVQQLDRKTFEQGELVAFNCYIDQIYLERSKPGLYESVTLYLPRLYVKQVTGMHARTTEEAISLFELNYNGPERDLPRELFRRFGKLQLEEIRKKLCEADFARAWPLLKIEMASYVSVKEAVNQ